MKQLAPLLGLLACGSRAAAPPPAPRSETASEAQHRTRVSGLDGGTWGEGQPERWTRAFDLDGDGTVDEIQPSFSGGAHCCYELTVRLSSTGRATRLPFELDGGYPEGIDLSRRDHFDVRAGRRRVEILMEIRTYGDLRSPLPASWRRLGVSSHRIAVSFPGARLRIRNLPEGEAFVTAALDL
ncbi:MAG: hypothetical protein JWM10_144 [Myxococcaceae bacterium]|nr:hypothetical protein [Myxococcaceae bacterium]